MEAPAAADSNESEKYYTLNDAIDEKGLTASKGNEREEHSAPVEAPDLKTSSNAPGTQYLSKSEAKGSRAGSELEKEVGLEAGHGSTSSVKKEETELMAETANPDVVDWDGPDDPQNALNWSPAMKSGNIAVMCVITFLTYGSSPLVQEVWLTLIIGPWLLQCLHRASQKSCRSSSLTTLSLPLLLCRSSSLDMHLVPFSLLLFQKSTAVCRFIILGTLASFSLRLLVPCPKT